MRIEHVRGFTLRAGQRWLARKIVETKSIILAVDMGSGKSAATLTAVRHLLDTFEVRRVLIIAPLRVANETWPTEIKEWSHTRALSFAVLTGTPEQRMAAVRRRTDIHIINRENIRWLAETWGDRWPYDMIVYDEASRLKGGRKRTGGTLNPKTGKKVGKNLSEFGSLCMVRKYVKRVVELSGTPAPNGLIDLWGPAYFADRGERLGTSRTAFEKRWFDTDYMGYSFEPKPNAEREIMGALSDMMFGLPPEYEVELPPVIYNPVTVTLPKKMMADYRAFEKSMVSETYDVEACSRGVLTNKLLQWANGSMYRMDEDVYPPKREIVHIHDLKLDGLGSVVEEAAGRSILLAYSFKFDLQRIKKRYPKAVIFDDEPDAVKLWNKGKIGMLLAHPASIGHGLNMQYGGHIACWFGLTWSLELYQQFNKRLARPGQEAEHVYIHHLVAKGTADETVMAAMQERGATQARITKAVQARLRG